MTSLKIASDMRELKNIQTEIKRLNEQLKTLREKKNTIESNILTYLKQTNQVGVKYEDTVVMLHDKKHRQRIKEKDKKEEVIRYLENSGIRDTENFYKEISEKMKGTQETISSIKLTEYKD